MSDIPHLHLTPMDEALVDALCDRAQRLVFDSYTVLREVDGFRQSRTPWDARRLANALAIDNPQDPLVKELDKLAHDRAGLVPAGWRTPS